MTYEPPTDDAWLTQAKADLKAARSQWLATPTHELTATHKQPFLQWNYTHADWALNYIDRCRSERAELIEALRPFAAVRGVPDNWPEQCSLVWDRRPDGTWFLSYAMATEEAGPRIGDYMRARSLLEKLDGRTE